jgi:hypothetical protein
MWDVVVPAAADISREDEILRRAGVGSDPAIPMIFVPTSLGGGEYSNYAGGTNSKTYRNDQLNHVKRHARIVILDPKLTSQRRLMCGYSLGAGLLITASKGNAEFRLSLMRTGRARRS